ILSSFCHPRINRRDLHVRSFLHHSSFTFSMSRKVVRYASRRINVSLYRSVIMMHRLTHTRRKRGVIMRTDKKMCKACDDRGMQSDDEGWQYKCRVSNGQGMNLGTSQVLEGDETTRLLD